MESEHENIVIPIGMLSGLKVLFMRRNRNVRRRSNGEMKVER